MRLAFRTCLCLVAGVAAVWGAEPPTAAATADLLRAGGYILYIRHAATDFSQNDAKMTSFEDCPTQRDLTTPERGT